MITVKQLKEFLNYYKDDVEVILDGGLDIKRVGMEICKDPKENYKVIISHTPNL